MKGLLKSQAYEMRVLKWAQNWKKAGQIIYLIHPDLLSSAGIPDDDGAVVVGRGQRALVEGAPADAADLGAADHLDAGVVDVDGVF